MITRRAGCAALQKSARMIKSAERASLDSRKMN
jgi:hypothetical protein